MQRATGEEEDRKLHSEKNAPSFFPFSRSNSSPRVFIISRKLIRTLLRTASGRLLDLLIGPLLRKLLADVFHQLEIVAND